MIQMIAGDIPLHEFVTDYKIDISPIISENSFRAASGKRIEKITGYKTVIDCTLKSVPHGTAENIANAVKCYSFNLTYTTPASVTNKFRCTKYNAVPKCADPRQKNPLITDKITWDISMTLESMIDGDTSADGL